jgi:putative NADH-flavin reductase
MRLLILGATGGTGRALIRQARERGHEVTAFVRSPQKLGPLADRVTVRQGNPQSVAELRAVLPGHDAVVSALGPPGPGPTTMLRAGARSTVEAMRTVGPRRLIVVSAAVLFDNLGVLGGLLRRTLLKNVAEDSAEMERIVMASGLDWTIARSASADQRPAHWPLLRRERTSTGPKRHGVDQSGRRRPFSAERARTQGLHPSHRRDHPRKER